VHRRGVGKKNRHNDSNLSQGTGDRRGRLNWRGARAQKKTPDIAAREENYESARKRGG